MRDENEKSELRLRITLDPYVFRDLCAEIEALPPRSRSLLIMRKLVEHEAYRQSLARPVVQGAPSVPADTPPSDHPATDDAAEQEAIEAFGRQLLADFEADLAERKRKKRNLN